jgi:hypothetical protein
MRTKTFSSLMLAAGLLAFSVSALHAQVGINPTGATPSINAILDLNSGTNNNLGFIPPSVSLTSLTTFNPPIANASTAGDVGMIVYNTNVAVGGGAGYYYWSGTQWISIGAVGGSGTLNYLARWTPNGNTLGIGATQDNGTAVGIDTASYPGVSLWVNASSVNGNSDGIIGYTSEAGYIGVAGLSAGYQGAGLFGEANDGVGVEGIAEDIGVLADADTIGLKAFADTAIAAYGSYSGVNAYGPTLGVFAISSQGYGILAEGLVGVVGADYGGDEGVIADSASGYGVAGVGYNEGGYFVDGAGDITKLADNLNGFGVTAYGANSGGYFQDNGSSFDYAYIADPAIPAGGYFQDEGGDYSYIAYDGYGILSSGVKSTEVKDESNQERVLFCDESPEVVFHDYGTAQLVNGTVHINLDPLYAKTVAINEKHPLRVMVTLNDECNGVFVKNRTATGFDVVELNHGTSNAAFTYEVIANRADTKNAKGEVYDYSNWRYPVGAGQIASAKQNTAKPLINGKKASIVAAAHTNNGIKHHVNISKKMPLTAAPSQGKN